MIPRTIYDQEHEIFRQSVHRFLEKEAVPHHAQWEKDGQVDRELRRKAGYNGFLSPTVPEAYGGFSADFRYNCIVDEEIAVSGLSGIGWGLHSDIAVSCLINYGSEAQKQHYLPKCVSGDIVTAIAMTEPGTGSDLQGIKTTTVRVGDGWRLNGSKTFITNGQHADLIIVAAETDPAKAPKARACSWSNPVRLVSGASEIWKKLG